MYGDDRLRTAEEKLNRGNQRAGYGAFENAYYNSSQVSGGMATVLDTGRRLRPLLTDPKWQAKWDDLIAKMQQRMDQAEQARVAAAAVPPADGAEADAQLPAVGATAEMPASAATAPAAAIPVGGVRSVGQSPVTQPYDWVTLIIGTYVVIAVLSVIGGFIEANNHQHVMFQRDFLGDLRPHKENDYNYAWAGVAAAFFWVSLATVMVLLRGIARDTRRTAELLSSAQSET